MLVGHQKIRAYFEKLADKDNLAHAYLFAGPEAVGKAYFANYLAQRIFCLNKEAPCGRCSSCRLVEFKNHPDLIVLKPKIEEKGEKTTKQKIAIAQVRSLQKQISLFPFQADKKVAIIKDAEFISREAANAFLKILEEPPQNTILILVSSSPRLLPPTLVSRCQEIKFSFLSKAEMVKFAGLQAEFGALSKTEQNLLLEISCGRPGYLLEFLRDRELRKFLWQQGEFFGEMFRLSLADRFLKLEKIVKDRRQMSWAVFLWLTLGHYALQKLSGLKILNDFDKLLPQTPEHSRLVKLVGDLQSFSLTIDDAKLNHRLLLENILSEI